MSSNKVVVTTEDRGPLINIVTWILLVVMCLATFVKLCSKWVLVHKLQYDDLYMFAAMFVTIGYDIAISLQVAAGLGKHQSALNVDHIVQFEQTAYVSQILYVVSLGLAKMAILQFLATLARKGTRRMVVKGVMGLNLIFVVATTFPVAFQCPLPQPWATISHKCLDQPALWDSFGVMDVLIDVATVLLPVYLLYDLHVKRSQKLPTIIAFTSRILILPIIIIRLEVLNSASNTVDHPFDDFNAAITTVIHVNLSIVVSCIPFLKPVMDSLQTGILASDIRTRTRIQSLSYPLGPCGNDSPGGAGSGLNKWTKTQSHGYSATARSGAHGKGRAKEPNSSAERMIIQQRTTVAVQYGDV